MLTKNFYLFVNSMALRLDTTFVLWDGSKKACTYLMISSTSYKAPFEGMYLHGTSTSSSGKNYTGVHFGSGTTPATVDDYFLENLIDNKLTVRTPSSTSCTATTDYIEYTATFGISPNSEAVTISEVGLFAGNSTSGTCMVDRTVLEEPITINPGETKQLTYTIRMNYPTA